MYSIEVAGYGLKLRTEGALEGEDAKAWAALYQQKLQEVVSRGRPFGQYVDMRGGKLLSPETQALVGREMARFKELGGQRSAGVLDNAIGAMQIKRLARESGIHTWQKYVDAETTPDFERVALAWVVDGIDPDLR